MNDEDKKYLKDTENKSPNIGVFNEMVRILNGVQKETDELQNTADMALLENDKAS